MGWFRLAAACLGGASLAFAIPLSAQETKRNLEGELGAKITAPFVVAAVGDIIAPQPFDRADPAYRSVTDPLRQADVAFANMESSLVDFSTFQDGAVAGTLAPLETGASLKALGIDIVNRANNHALDGGVAGMKSTDAALSDLGIVGAGTGPNLQEARAARFFETPKGRVGLVGMFSLADTGLFGPNYAKTEATARDGNIGGSPGINPLHVTAYNVVTPATLQQLKALAAQGYGARKSAEIAATATTPERFRFYDQWYEAGADVGAIRYEMDAADLQEQLAAIRSGKVQSDFLVATIHAHQTPKFCAACAFGKIKGLKEDYSHDPADFVIALAHAAIDNGADMFVVHGVHALAGIEVYKGKPIYYGLSNFVFQFPLQFGSGYDAMANYEKRAELENHASLVSVVASSRFEGGKLAEIVLHPVDLGDRSRPLSQLGLPQRPAPESAREILEALATYSRPFGTRIEVRGALGFIRP